MALLAVAFAITPSLSFVPEAEFARTHVDASVSICYVVDVEHNCLHRPNRESMVALGGALDWHPLHRAPLRPHVAAGIARVWSGSSPSAGESSSFYAPQVTAGLTAGRWPEWSVDVRVRRLDRWGSMPTSSQGALLVGFTF